MKLKVPRIFKVEAMNDHELLFCWFLGKFFDRYGWDQHFTIDAYDAKLILTGKSKSQLNPNTLKKNVTETIDVAFYNSARLGVQVTPGVLSNLKKHHMYSGKIAVGSVEVDITSKQVILMYSYLLGILGIMNEWTYESDSPTGLKAEELNPWSTRNDTRVTSGFELQQLLDALD